ncbi:LytR/AlgR family response regulator transcription factor [Clostridium sp.]|uniref:LytR/AlgR family response regulator transcription factor n=1 Tax=Clostridium sp. TaxID=1506 RepID=UPI003F2B9B8C
MIKIAICDDEDIFINKYMKIISNIKKNKNYGIEIFTFNSGEELLKYIFINKVKFDLVFLDIIMKEINGIETARKIKEIYELTEIVLLTSSKEYALDAYDVKVFNYIIKSSQQLESKINEAIKHCYSKINDYIIINNKSSIEKIEICKIVYIESNKRKLIITTTDSKHEIYEKLDNIYNKIENYGFIKTHKSYIINMNFIKRIDSKEVITTKEEVIPISRGNSSTVKEKFMKYLEYLT